MTQLHSVTCAICHSRVGSEKSAAPLRGGIWGLHGRGVFAFGGFHTEATEENEFMSPGQQAPKLARPSARILGAPSSHPWGVLGDRVLWQEDHTRVVLGVLSFDTLPGIRGRQPVSQTGLLPCLN